MSTDERALKLALKIKNSFDPDYGSEVDDMLVHAIKLTTQLAAEKAAQIREQYRERYGDTRADTVNSVCKALDRFDHLPADGGENV